MEDNKIEFSHSNYNLIDAENKVIGKMLVKKNLRYQDLMKSCDIALSSVIMKRSLLGRSLKFGQTKTKEDYLLWLKISKITKIYGINKSLLFWRKTDNSLSSNALQKIYDAYTVYDQIEKKNFFITSFFVLRLSIFFLFKKIKQKII